MADDDRFAFKPSRRQFLTGGVARVASPMLRSEAAAAMTPEAEEAYHFGYSAHTHGITPEHAIELAKDHGVASGHEHHILRGFKLAEKHASNKKFP